MEVDAFRRMVTRLEAESVASPRTYQWKVAAWAAIGLLVLGLLLGAVGAGLLLSAG